MSVSYLSSSARVERILSEEYSRRRRYPAYADLTVKRLSEFLPFDVPDLRRVSFGESSARRVEAEYIRRVDAAIVDSAARAIAELDTGGFDPARYDFLPLVLEHSVAAMAAGIRSADGHYGGVRRLASYVPKARVPRSLPELFALWDKWRNGEALPARQQRNARVIKDVFLRTVEQFWKTNSEDYRRGRKYTQEDARRILAEKAKIPMARAQNIVATETTVFYNTARRELYDQADGVTHYLYAAIRDARTSKWCTGFEKGGRDGLVYKKGSPYLIRETPACHWYCRSTILPLSPSSAKQLVLIRDERRARWANNPAPLPPGWNGRATRVG